jgi:serine/threonine-protein kinase
MAAVYAATHRNGMRGAVKLLHAGQSSDENIRARFLHEGYIANRVKHPGAVRVLDDDASEDGAAFLVMELLAGQDLQERAAERGGRLAAREVMVITDQLLDTLAAAHAEGIVHRDIKPENLFLTRDGRVKVLDFGIARLSEPVGGPPSTTRSGVAIGTPAFMAPEQARGRGDLVGARSDVWAVGATMFTLLTGQLVHVEQTSSELLAAAFTKPARSLAEALPGAHAALVAVVDRALALELSDRWPSARAMQGALRDAYRRVCGETLPAVVVPAPAPRWELEASLSPVETPTRRTTPRRRALAVAGLVAASAIAAFATLSEHARERTARAAAAAPTPEVTASHSAVPASSAAPVANAPAVKPPVAVAKSVRAAPSRKPAPTRAPAARTNAKSMFDRRF